MSKRQQQYDGPTDTGLAKVEKMGSQMSAEQSRDLLISQSLERDAMEEGNDVKFAVGGMENAGKKTILRQLKNVFDPNYRLDNPKQHTLVIHENIIKGLKTLVTGIRRLHHLNLDKNKVISQQKIDAQKIAEELAQQALAEAAAAEETDEDSSSEVTADTDEEEEVKQAAKEEKEEQMRKRQQEEETKQKAKADAEAKAKAEAKERNSSDEGDASEKSDDQSSSENEESDAEEGQGKDTEVEEGMERIPNLKKLDNYFRVIEMYEDDESIAYEHIEVFGRLWKTWEAEETMRLRDVLKLRIDCDLKYFMERLEEVTLCFHLTSKCLFSVHGPSDWNFSLFDGGFPWQVVSEDYDPPLEAVQRVPCPAASATIDNRVIDHVRFTIIDLSPQADTKINKWVHLLSNLNSFIFVVAIDEFDMQMEHDPTLNRITESAKMLRTIMENKSECFLLCNQTKYRGSFILSH